MENLENQPIIDRARIDLIWKSCTEVECRNFAKLALRFLNKGHSHLERIAQLNGREATLEMNKKCGLLKEASAAVGAGRIEMICVQLEEGALDSAQRSILVSTLEKEFRLAELHIWQLVKALGVESARRSKAQAAKMSLRLFPSAPR